MIIPRRAFLRLATGALALPALPHIAQAAPKAQTSRLDDTYPSRPVHIIVGLGAGSASDLIGRLAGQKLSERLGKPFVVENKPGAAGSIAAEDVVHASPDGYTLLLTNAADPVSATLNNKPEIIRDIAPIALIARGPLVMVVHPSVPAKTVPEFIAYTKANPGKINFGSTGVGSLVQLAGELFKAMAGVNMVHVPYRTMPSALTDLIAGQVQVVFSTLPPALPQVRAGRLRALAVTSAARSAALRGLPTVSDFLPGYEASFSAGLGAPRKVPIAVVDKLNGEINVALGDPDMRAQLNALGALPAPMTPGDYGKYRADEVEKWRKVIKSAGIHPA